MNLLTLENAKRYVVAMVAYLTLTAIALPIYATNLRTVALTGQQVPGVSDGVVFQLFHAPTLNNLGQTAFSASGDLLSGIWSEGSGRLSLIARAGFQAPGIPIGQVFDGLSPDTSMEPRRTPLLLNDAGQVAFRARLEVGIGGATTSDWNGIWHERAGSLELVARQGSQVPGMSEGTVFDYMYRPTLSDTGQIAFAGLLRVGIGGVTNDNSQGIWAHRNGALSLIHRRGDQAPGMPSGVVFGDFNDLVVNGAGQMAFVASASGIGRGVWAEGDGATRLVARAGNQPPGTPSGTRFDSFANMSINNAGDVAFRGFMPAVPGGQYQVLNQGIWKERNGLLRLVTRQGAQPPGVPPGAKFEDLSSMVFNDLGQIAFVGSMLRDGGGGVSFLNSTGIWAQKGGALDLIAREGAQAPAMPNGTIFERFWWLACNNAGQIAFSADTPFHTAGIWAQDRLGVLRLIVAEGQQIDVDDGPGVDLRTYRQSY